MKKVIFVLVLFFTLPIVTLADSYSSLWKRYEQLQKKNQPRSALNVLKEIITKAREGKSYGNLIKSELEQLATLQDLSGDSLQPQLERLRVVAEKTKKSEPVVYAIYNNVLGRLYQSHFVYNADSMVVCKRFFERSMQDPALLAAVKVDKYTPLMVTGIDSRIFNDDLLHVLGIVAGDYHTLYQWYSSHNNRSAACYCAFKLLEEQHKSSRNEMKHSKYLQRLDSLISCYQDLPIAGELAIARYEFMDQANDVTAVEKMNYLNYALSKWGNWPRMNILRNAQSRLTLPSFIADFGPSVQLPNKEIIVRIRQLTNIQSLTMTVTRLNVRECVLPNQNGTYDFDKLGKLLLAPTAVSLTHRYVGLPAYQVSSDSMRIAPLQKGVYLIEFSTDNKEITPKRALLHISDIYLLQEQLPEEKSKLIVLSATTGKPIPNAKINVQYRVPKSKEPKYTTTLLTDKQGEVTFKQVKDAYSIYYQAYTSDDKFCLSTSPGSYYSAGDEYTKEDEDDFIENHIQLYTDRSLYRPGQQVKVSLINYKTDSRTKKATVNVADSVTLVLNDVDDNEIATKKVVTDEFGTASATFDLPKSCKTGEFSIEANEDDEIAFHVEEYKRPTFTVDFTPYKKAYQNGDTIHIEGKAKSYVGAPVQHAKVVYTVTRRPLWTWWRATNESQMTLGSDTIKTDESGQFRVPVKLIMPETNNNLPRYYFVEVNATVTDGAGESHEGITTLLLSNRSSYFNCQIPERIERDSMLHFTFEYKNLQSENIAGKVNYKIDNTTYQANTNEPIALNLQKFKTGVHLLEAICNEDTLHRSFTVFSLKDKKPAAEMKDWFYVSGKSFKEDGKPIYVQLGSSLKDVKVYYTILSGSKILENGSFVINDELRTRTFKYKEEYHDGIRLAYAWVKDGELFVHNVNIQRPIPVLKLKTKWITFRDKLTPGQQETWTLQITDKDGKPARSQLMATMYDMSLDDIYGHRWNLFVDFSWSLPYFQWSGNRFSTQSLYGEMPLKQLYVRPFDFTHYVLNDGIRPAVMIRGAVAGVQKSMATGSYTVYDSAESSLFGSRSPELQEVVTLAYSASKTRTEAPKPKQEQVPLRKNFNETAFFFPALQTDNKGNVSIKFTLPESVTTWRFMGLAHDKHMNNALVEAITVAKKSVMIMPNMPRFIRMGDESVLSNRIVNTTNVAQTAQVEMQILDPKTEKQLLSSSKKITLAANSTSNCDFTFVPSQLRSMGYDPDAVVCRMTVNGESFSDGEQHLLPILSDKEHIVTTLAFSQYEPGTETIAVDKLFPVKKNDNKLKVTYTNNPAWMMVEALPTIAHASTKDAIGLAAKYYANSLSAHLMQIAGQNDSLSVMNAYKEESLFALRQLQLADGSFAWWPGMRGSFYVTVAVTEMLQRLNMMLGEQTSTKKLLTNSMKFMAGEVSKHVEVLKHLEAKKYDNLLPSEADMQYLYICAMRKEGLNHPDNKYLLGLVEKRPALFTIYGKAMMSVILARNGNEKLAKEHLESLKQYTVYTDEMGRYFDTKSASYSWFDYRIPTEVAAIEAIKMVTPEDKKTVSEMQRWLLQSKRTQSWDTPINAVNAIYAFMQGQTKESLTNYGANTVLKLNGTELKTKETSVGRAMVEAEKTGKRFGVLTAEKTSNNISWGAVYAEYDQDIKDVSQQSTQLSVTRQLIDADGKVVTTDKFKVGDKLRVRITLKADRDYDFVEVVDKRPACLEPVDQMSGFNWQYYYAPGDYTTNYYFDCLSKGTHVIETEYYIDREGAYMSGICTARCTYSPEFSGHDKAIKLNNEK